MIFRIRQSGGALALAAVLGLSLNTMSSTAAAHCGSCQADEKHASKASKMDIVDTAVAAGDFTTLVAAVKAAGLAEALKGEGPFTVFAPSDAAFAALPKGTVESLLKAENRKKLASILTYHVVAGNVGSDQAMKLESASTLNGQPIGLEVKDGSLHAVADPVSRAWEEWAEPSGSVLFLSGPSRVPLQVQKSRRGCVCGRSTPSSVSSSIFAARPPVKPPRLPCAAMTR